MHPTDQDFFTRSGIRACGQLLRCRHRASRHRPHASAAPAPQRCRRSAQRDCHRDDIEAVITHVCFWRLIPPRHTDTRQRPHSGTQRRSAKLTRPPYLLSRRRSYFQAGLQVACLVIYLATLMQQVETDKVYNAVMSVHNMMIPGPGGQPSVRFSSSAYVMSWFRNEVRAPAHAASPAAPAPVAPPGRASAPHSWSRRTALSPIALP